MSYRGVAPGPPQEEDDLPRGRVIFGAVVVLVITGVIIAWAITQEDAYEARYRPFRVFPEQALGPRRAVARTPQDLFEEGGPGRALNERKRRELESYGWVDRERRIVRIPIDAAIDLVVEEGGKLGE
jgi:hypothetical protein